MKNRSHRYDINRLKSRHRHKYSKYKNTAQKMKFSITDFFSECDQIRRKLRMENFIFCAMKVSL